jgi:hypothetical protein
MKFSEFPNTESYLKTFLVGEGKTDDFQIPDWVYGPCGITKDSTAGELRNFDTALEYLDTIDPYGNDYEVVRFGHFAAGWFQGIFYRPGSDAGNLVEQMRETIRDKFLLD